MDKIINPAQAANAYGSTSKTIDAPGLDSGKKDSFSDILRNTAVKGIERCFFLVLFSCSLS